MLNPRKIVAIGYNEKSYVNVFEEETDEI